MSKKSIFKDIIDRSITEITIPNGIQYICPYLFYNCLSLQTAIVPNSVSAIGTRAFTRSEGELVLKTITFNQPSGMEITLPTAGTAAGMFFCKTASALTVYTDNETIKNYDYASDNVTATIYHLDGTLWE